MYPHRKSFPAAKGKGFNKIFPSRLALKGKERWRLLQDGVTNRGRRQGGEGAREILMGTGVFMVVLRKMAHRLSVVGSGEGAMPPRIYGVLGAVGAGGCSNAIIPAWPY